MSVVGYRLSEEIQFSDYRLPTTGYRLPNVVNPADG
jgi:hypothetical protein